MSHDNSDARTQRLLHDYRAYNQAIVTDMAHAEQMALGKAETLRLLRRDHSASEIARLLGVTRQSVYALLREAGEPEPDQDEAQRLLDDQVRSALRDLHIVMRDAQSWIAPFFETDLVLTPERRQIVDGVFSRLKGAQDAYDTALRNSGRLVPNRG